MRFLMFAASEGDFEGKAELSGMEDWAFGRFLREGFNIDERSTEAIVYALAFCVSAEGTPTLSHYL